MKQVFKIILIILLQIGFASAYSVRTMAQGNIDFQIPNPSRYNSLEDIINAGSSLIQPLFILTFGGMILLGASLILTSQGNQDKIENARKTMVAAIIGFVIAVFAPSIVNFILNLLGVDGLTI